MNDELAELNLDVAVSQLSRESNFGRALIEAALESETIVEVGTFNGLGSTYCLFCGLARPTQRLWTIEMSASVSQAAAARYSDPRIVFLHGTLVLPAEVPEFDFPDASFRHYYDDEVQVNATAPYVLDQLPDAIDLLMLDGGEWSASVEFNKLHGRCRRIAMDDTNPALVHKNVANRVRLLGDPAWRVLHDRLDERQGWAIFERL